MAMQNWVILTEAELAIAKTLDDDENYVIGTRAVDNANPGLGININPNALDYPDGGEVVVLVGKFVAPKLIVDDPDCTTYAPDLKNYLLTLPWAMLEAETIFAPPEM